MPRIGHEYTANAESTIAARADVWQTIGGEIITMHTSFEEDVTKHAAALNPDKVTWLERIDGYPALPVVTEQNLCDFQDEYSDDMPSKLALSTRFIHGLFGWKDNLRTHERMLIAEVTPYFIEVDYGGRLPELVLSASKIEELASRKDILLKVPGVGPMSVDFLKRYCEDLRVSQLDVQ